MSASKVAEPTAHILVLDDDQCVHNLLAPAFAARGLVAHAATSLDQAQRLMAERSFDMLLLDSRLPDGRGEDLLRAEPQRRSTPVIILTAFCREPARRRQLEALGANEVICKPFLPAELLTRVESLLDLTSATRQYPAVDAPAEEPASMPAGSNELQSKFEQLRLKYAAKLPAKIDKLAAALASASDNDQVTEPLEQAKTLAHRLRGTAGSYGFGSVGRAAGQLEDLLQPVIRGESALSDIQSAVAELMRLLRGAVDEERSNVDNKSAEWSQRAASLGAGSAAAGTAGDTRRTVLLLSGDPAFAQQLADAAGSSLLHAASCASASEALDQANSLPLAAALIDVDLPDGESAVGVARRLRAIDGLAALPIAFVCADGALNARVAAAHAGARLFLTKPLGDHELVDALRQLTVAREGERPRLLLVDDDADFAHGLSALLAAEQTDVHVLLDPTRIVETLDQVRPDVLLLDVVLPSVNGLQLCRIVRTNPRWQMLPVLMLTSLASEDSRLAAFEAGADDYLLKPIVKQELLARIRLRIDHARLVRERSTRDALTGVLTRRAFVESFATRLAETDRSGGLLSLCLLDLDHFKQINDRHGHLAGDRVLAALGRALESRFRECDLRGRWGGEEFIVAFPGADAAATAEIVARLQTELLDTIFLSDKGEKFLATFSGGISTYPADGTSLEQLIRAADERLYAAKGAGRNRIERGATESPPAAEQSAS